MESIEKIKKIIFDNIDNKVNIEDSTDLRTGIQIDSFDALMIMTGIEDEFKITLEEDEFKKVGTPLQILSLLKEKYGVK
ncbi:MAG TPA: acyl carrier protein [Clostridiales bacterium]|nr:acyl carrier protein [Clostridiales bacterium]HQP69890.1 acyl carrier protein [Clostridiales bacterium]